MKEFKTRKSHRLKEYDYSDNGWYFITVCSKDRENIFGEYSQNIVGVDGGRPFNKIILNEYGLIVDDELKKSEIIRDRKSVV